jgi:hypothetical protein
LKSYRLCAVTFVGGFRGNLYRDSQRIVQCYGNAGGLAAMAAAATTAPSRDSASAWLLDHPRSRMTLRTPEAND